MNTSVRIGKLISRNILSAGVYCSNFKLLYIKQKSKSKLESYTQIKSKFDNVNRVG